MPKINRDFIRKVFVIITSKDTERGRKSKKDKVYEDIERFYDGAKKLGFEVIDNLSGYVEASRRKRDDFKIYVATLRKVGNPIKKSIDPKYFTFIQDNFVNAKHSIPNSLGDRNNFYIEQDGEMVNLDKSLDDYISSLEGGY